MFSLIIIKTNDLAQVFANFTKKTKNILPILFFFFFPKSLIKEIGVFGIQKTLLKEI